MLNNYLAYMAIGFISLNTLWASSAELIYQGLIPDINDTIKRANNNNPQAQDEVIKLFKQGLINDLKTLFNFSQWDDIENRCQRNHDLLNLVLHNAKLKRFPVIHDYCQNLITQHPKADINLLPEFNFTLGTIHLANKNYDRALTFYKIAGKAGHVIAQNNLGVLYSEHFKKTKKSIKWYKKSAKQGFALSQFYLAMIYDPIIGFQPDAELAFQWYLRAARQGDRMAQTCLGLCYKDGLGVEKNDDEALMWFQFAANQDFTPAWYNLAELYTTLPLNKPHKKLITYYYEKAADHGNYWACMALGDSYAAMILRADSIKAIDYYFAASQDKNIGLKNFKLFIPDHIKNYLNIQSTPISPVTQEGLTFIKQNFKDTMKECIRDIDELKFIKQSSYNADTNFNNALKQTHLKTALTYVEMIADTAGLLLIITNKIIKEPTAMLKQLYTVDGLFSLFIPGARSLATYQIDQDLYISLFSKAVQLRDHYAFLIHELDHQQNKFDTLLSAEKTYLKNRILVHIKNNEQSKIQLFEQEYNDIMGPAEEVCTHLELYVNRLKRYTHKIITHKEIQTNKRNHLVNHYPEHDKLF